MGDVLLKIRITHPFSVTFSDLLEIQQHRSEDKSLDLPAISEMASKFEIDQTVVH